MSAAQVVETSVTVNMYNIPSQDYLWNDSWIQTFYSYNESLYSPTMVGQQTSTHLLSIISETEELRICDPGRWGLGRESSSLKFSVFEIV